MLEITPITNHHVSCNCALEGSHGPQEAFLQYLNFGEALWAEEKVSSLGGILSPRFYVGFFFLSEGIKNYLWKIQSLIIQP